MAGVIHRNRGVWGLLALALAALACSFPAFTAQTPPKTATVPALIPNTATLPGGILLPTRTLEALLPTLSLPATIPPSPTPAGIQVATLTQSAGLPTLEPVMTPAPQATEWVSPRLPEQRLLSLEWPSRLRVGDADVIKLTLEVDEQGIITPTTEIGGHEIISQPVVIPNLYETHDLVLESRLDLAGVEVEPAGSLSSPLQPGTTITFYWSLSADHPGTYRGTLWVYLNLIPRDGTPTQQQTLLGKRLDIEAQNLLGLTGGAARTSGVIGAIVGFILNIPFLEDILKFLARHLHRR